MEEKCKREKNLKECKCSYKGCSRKGLCCECLSFYWAQRELPGCLLPPDAERTYDRSLEYFIEVWSKRLRG